MSHRGLAKDAIAELFTLFDLGPQGQVGACARLAGIPRLGPVVAGNTQRPDQPIILRITDLGRAGIVLAPGVGPVRILGQFIADPVTDFGIQRQTPQGFIRRGLVIQRRKPSTAPLGIG